MLKWITNTYRSYLLWLTYALKVLNIFKSFSLRVSPVEKMYKHAVYRRKGYKGMVDSLVVILRITSKVQLQP